MTSTVLGNASPNVEDVVNGKLRLDGGLTNLPRPDSILAWEASFENLPSVTNDAVEGYFTQVNQQLGTSSKTCEALKLGKGLVLSKHINNVLYSSICVNVVY